MRHTSANCRREAKRVAKKQLEPTGIARFCVLYIGGGSNKERRSPWFASRERANLARNIIGNRVGYANTVVFVD